MQNWDFFLGPNLDMGLPWSGCACSACTPPSRLGNSQWEACDPAVQFHSLNFITDIKRGMGAEARTLDVTQEAHCKDSLLLFEVHQFLAVWDISCCPPYQPP